MRPCERTKAVQVQPVACRFNFNISFVLNCNFYFYFHFDSDSGSGFGFGLWFGLGLGFARSHAPTWSWSNSCTFSLSIVSLVSRALNAPVAAPASSLLHLHVFTTVRKQQQAANNYFHSHFLLNFPIISPLIAYSSLWFSHDDDDDYDDDDAASLNNCFFNSKREIGEQDESWETRPNCAWRTRLQFRPNEALMESSRRREKCSRSVGIHIVAIVVIIPLNLISNRQANKPATPATGLEFGLAWEWVDAEGNVKKDVGRRRRVGRRREATNRGQKLVRQAGVYFNY